MEEDPFIPPHILFLREKKFGHWLIDLWIVMGLFWVFWIVPGEALTRSDPLRQPWPAGNPGVRSESPAVSKSRCEQVTGNSFWQESLLSGVRLFQIFISPADGDRCPMFPSCSHYAVEAIRTYGPWRGLIMTLDRLMRCGREGDYPLVQNQEKFFYYDPLGDNAIWP